MRALSIGATGMMAQQLNVETISNNIANMSTTGYKRERAEFQDLLYQQERRVGSPTSDSGTEMPSGVQLGLGVKTAAISRDNGQGPLQKTDNRLDVAMQGPGLFTIQLPSGDTAYTRAGFFQMAADGTIVTSDGFPVQPNIVVPPTPSTSSSVPPARCSPISTARWRRRIWARSNWPPSSTPTAWSRSGAAS